MPAKTRSPRLPKIPDIQERLKAHMEANEQAARWAHKAAEHLAAGDRAAAASAYAKARRYVARMSELERGSKAERH